MLSQKRETGRYSQVAGGVCFESSHTQEPTQSKHRRNSSTPSLTRAAVLKRNAVEPQSSSCTIEKPHHIPIAPEARGSALGVSFPLPLPLLVGSGFPVGPSVFRRITTSSLLIGAVGRLVAGLVSTFVIFVRRRSIPWGAWSPAAAPSVAAGSCHRAELREVAAWHFASQHRQGVGALQFW